MGKHFRELIDHIDGTATIQIKDYYSIVAELERLRKSALETHRILSKDRANLNNDISKFNNGLTKTIEFKMVWADNMRSLVEEASWYSKDDALKKITETLLDSFKDTSVKEFKEFRKNRKNKRS